MDKAEMEKCRIVFDEIRKELPSMVARAKAETRVKERHEKIADARREDALAGRMVPWTWEAKE